MRLLRFWKMNFLGHYGPKPKSGHSVTHIYAISFETVRIIFFSRYLWFQIWWDNSRSRDIAEIFASGTQRPCHSSEVSFMNQMEKTACHDTLYTYIYVWCVHIKQIRSRFIFIVVECGRNGFLTTNWRTSIICLHPGNNRIIPEFFVTIIPSYSYMFEA